MGLEWSAHWQVLEGTDTSAFHPIQVFLSFSPGGAREQVERLFSTYYDIRDSSGRRLAAPDSIGLSVVAYATRNTILALTKESYVREVEPWVMQIPLVVTFREGRPARKGGGRRTGYRVDGRWHPRIGKIGAADRRPALDRLPESTDP